MMDPRIKPGKPGHRMVFKGEVTPRPTPAAHGALERWENAHPWNRWSLVAAYGCSQSLKMDLDELLKPVDTSEQITYDEEGSWVASNVFPS